MPITVKRITLWRAEVDNQPGMLARTLEPLAAAGADLRVVMGYRFPQAPQRSAIELYPVSGKRVTTAAQQVGLAEAKDIPCLLVEGDNRPGLGAAIGRGLADARINVAFLMAQVLGRKFTAAIGFDDESAATNGARIIKQAARPATEKRSRRRKA
jgi:hypothetical protein